MIGRIYSIRTVHLLNISAIQGLLDASPNIVLGPSAYFWVVSPVTMGRQLLISVHFPPIIVLLQRGNSVIILSTKYFYSCGVAQFWPALKKFPAVFPMNFWIVIDVISIKAGLGKNTWSCVISVKAGLRNDTQLLCYITYIYLCCAVALFILGPFLTTMHQTCYATSAILVWYLSVVIAFTVILFDLSGV